MNQASNSLSRPTMLGVESEHPGCHQELEPEEAPHVDEEQDENEETAWQTEETSKHHGVWWKRKSGKRVNCIL
ncbi:unnamed protein product [Prunus armeniaca]|uniref:Uncharacterized protein n=1 Tax=Prunus armeniaca TaxID=36596 RepID=A0A6J5W9U1_PRUAR|nr:unnamed protein product [Prunus armeniaca]